MPTNTYAINTTRNKEFKVEADLREMGLKPWLPRALISRKLPEKKDLVWYPRPYIPKLLFCVIPAIYFRDVLELKQIHGKPLNLSFVDIHGVPKGLYEAGKLKGRRPCLDMFKEAVEAEYAATERLRDLGEWECVYRPGQALEILSGPFEGLTGKFQQTVKDAWSDHPMLQLHVDIFGRKTPIELAPDAVSC